VLDWMVYLGTGEEREPLLGGMAHSLPFVLRYARDVLKEEMQEGTLFLWDIIELGICGREYFVGTVGEFSGNQIFTLIGW